MAKLILKVSAKNTKLGKIPSFSLSALKSCPTATEWCSKHCYALKLERLFPNVKKAYKVNLNAVNQKTFVERMIQEVKASTKESKVFRIHVSGDWFSVRYIYDWVKVAKACSDITFYGYTRGWESPDLLPHLGILNKLPNMTIFASVDSSTLGKAPKTWRVAYAGDTKPTTNFVACPQQEGKVDLCTTCKLCFNPKAKSNIFFKTH